MRHPNALAVVLLLLAAPSSAQQTAPDTAGAPAAEQEPAAATETAAAPEAETEPAMNGKPLRVGIFPRPPFAIRTVDGAWLGIGPDLWRLAAEDLGLSYRYVEIERGGAATALSAGEIDLALPVDATPALEDRAELSHPFYTATMGVAAERRSRLLDVLSGFLSFQFLRLVLALSALLLVVGAVIWLLERRRNGEQFNPSVVRGLGDGFWWAGVTLTTIGYGDKAPVTLAGRAVAMLWMLVGLAVSAALTAAVVTLANFGQDAVDLPESFAGETVATVSGSSAELLLQRAAADLRAYPTLEAALQGVSEGEADVAAAAAPALSHAVGEASLELTVERTSLDPHYVAIALAPGSPLRKPLNRSLLKRLGSESGWNLIQRYLPEG